MERSILYFGDPMCSWCWGFAPALNKISETYDDQAPLSIILGGLHAYDTMPMGAEYKASIRHHWEDVNKMTGAEFDYAFFDRTGFVLDTEPACRAVITMRHLNSDRLLEFYESISRSFYKENKDTTALETFLPLAEAIGIDSEAFSEKFSSDALKEEAQNEFNFTKSLGITGFPTLVAKEGERMALLSAGCRTFETLSPLIDGWLRDGMIDD